MNAYVDLCENCYNDLYRIAYLTMGDVVVASELVEKTCVRGVHICADVKDQRGIKIALTGALYRFLFDKLRTYVPKALNGKDPFAIYTAQERLLVLMRFKSGLRLSELSNALAMPAEEISKKVSYIIVGVSQEFRESKRELRCYLSQRSSCC